MALAKVAVVEGHGVSVLGDDIDTDRIIPARFMKCVTFEGLGQFVFYDVRFDAAGQAVEHPLNDRRFSGASILLSGSNFGCGSSREHAPQALYSHGIRAIVAESFAEIFFGNSTTLGMPCVMASRADIAVMAAIIESEPLATIVLNLLDKKVVIGDRKFSIEMASHAREALMAGRWDAIADLLDQTDAVKKTAQKLDYFTQSQ